MSITELCVCVCVRHRDCPDSIELLRPVSGSLPGDRVFIAGLTESRTETPDVLNPKKKIWDKLQVRNCSFIWYSVCLSVCVCQIDIYLHS